MGALILGHAPEKIVLAVEEAAKRGLSYGAPTAAEIDLAEKISNLMPNLAKVRLMNSGTEVTMTAIRLARGYTGRDKILKFNSCYHGHVDALLIKAGSGLASFGIPDSAGVLKVVAQQTLSVDFNNLEQVTQTFVHYGKEIAAVIIEPIAANMNCVLPLSGFLEGLRELCDYYGSVLIFDEVISGFRKLTSGLLELAKAAKIHLKAHYIGGLFGFLFSQEDEVYNYQQVKLSNQLLFKEFFYRMLA